MQRPCVLAAIIRCIEPTGVATFPVNVPLAPVTIENEPLALTRIVGSKLLYRGRRSCHPRTSWRHSFLPSQRSGR